MASIRRFPTLTPNKLAISYLAFGIIWILSTDTIVNSIAQTQAELTRLQTGKGWGFVLVSTALLFGLAYSREKQIESERDFTEHALDSLNDIFVVLGVDHTVERVNDRAVAVTGYSEEEFYDMVPTELFDPDDRDTVASAIEEAFETGEARAEATIVSQAGNRIQYEFRGRRMEDDDGEERGVAIIGRDITERVLYEQRLDVTLRALRHNLRNQLNLIQGWAADIKDSSEYAEVRDSILGSADKLLDMSSKARRIAELGTNGPIGRRTIPLRDSLTTLLNEFRETHPTALIESDYPANDKSIESRENLFEMAVFNVIENAIEHNDSDEPWIRVELEVEPNLARITVHDNGPGIPQHEGAVQEAGEETTLVHSSGFGLWLVRWCVDVLGGEVIMENRQPTGSTVTLEFPTELPAR